MIAIILMFLSAVFQFSILLCMSQLI